MILQDRAKLQEQLHLSDRDYQLELQYGNIVVITIRYRIQQIGTELIRLLGNGVKPRRLRLVFDSIGGFIMPNTDLFAPDVVFVSAQRLRQTVRDFAELVPDLVMEIKSKTDCIHLLQEKIQLFLTLEAL